MTIEKWLSNVYYDEYGTHIWNKEDANGGSQLVADVRGWGRLQNEFKTEEEAAKFQDEIGRFIAEAVREKLARTSSQTEISDEEIKKQANIHGYEEHSFFTAATSNQKRLSWIAACKWYREQLKQRQ
jgi:hypothetical protein